MSMVNALTNVTSVSAIAGAAPRLLLLGCLLVCSGCWFQKAKPVAFTPPPPHPPAKLGPAPELPGPPEVEVDLATNQSPELPPDIPDLPEPPKPKPSPPKPPVIAGPKVPQTLPDIPAAPKLGQIFTPEQIREYNKDLDENLDRVRKALTALARKRLNPDDAITVERIRTFLKQAEEARKDDLVTAVQLAKRADALAKDLQSH
jgi:hypothetical protein